MDSILGTLAKFPPCELLLRDMLTAYMEEVTDEESPQRFSVEKLRRIGIICSQLIYTDRRYLPLLPTHEDLLTLLGVFDAFVQSDVVAKYGLFPDDTSPESSEVRVPTTEEQLLRFMENSARKAMIYLTIDCEDKAHDISLAYAAAVVPVVNLLYETRWECSPRSEVFTDCIKLWEDVFQRTALATQRAIAAFTHLPTAPSSAQLALRVLCENGASWQKGKTEEKNIAWYWATLSDCSGVKLETVERWISRFHAESAIEFLAHIHEYIQRNTPEWQDTMFSGSALDAPSYRISFLCLHAAVSIFGDISLISSLTPELLDFIMCGVVTAMDSCDEAIGAKIPSSHKLETLAGLSLKMFERCAKTALEKFCNSLDTEWPNFFLPTMSRIIVRWFTLLNVDAKPTFFVRTLVKALLYLRELPDDLSLKKKLSPELDRFEYDAMHQTLIIQAEDLVVSENPFIQFAALHMLKVLTPIMYRQENEQWTEEEKVSATGPRHLVVPDTLSKLIDGTTGW
ncbi:unnamed protein product, partial [Cylicostephanus goldi]